MAQPGKSEQDFSINAMDEILASIRKIISETDASKQEDTIESTKDLSEGEENQNHQEVASSFEEIDKQPASFDKTKEEEGVLDEQTGDGDEGSFHSLDERLVKRSFSEFEEDKPNAEETALAPEAAKPSTIPAYNHHAPDIEQSSNIIKTKEEVRKAIISPQASGKIAEAFEELRETFSSSRKRGFDEVVEEMLRPMLHDWLDNNLPLLVERLVREEIERIARGEE